MVYFSGNTHRSLFERVVRKLLGLAAVALIVFVLWGLPYDILREERYRLYGETRTTGLVTEVGTAVGSDDVREYFIDYKYIDHDGFARESQAELPKKIWDRFQPGSRVEVLYVSGRPALVRIPGEIEHPFQTWLRNTLD